jgi:hypothetical protein
VTEIFILGGIAGPTPNPQRGTVLVNQASHSVSKLDLCVCVCVRARARVRAVLSRSKVEILGVLLAAINVLFPQRIVVCL